MKGRILRAGLTAAVVGLMVAACAAKAPVRPELLEGPGYTRMDSNLHQIEGPPPGKDAPPAFRLYRSGAPGQETFAKWCGEYRIERVIVLAGTAESYELKYQAEGICPGIQVLYNEHQTVGEPVSDGFLKWFDQQVEAAKRDQVGILFRCQTGSHRAGRLAAYYQMKYQGLSADEAIAVMNHNGMLMPLFDPKLKPQVRALAEYLHGRPCAQKAKACVQMSSNAYLP